MAPYDSDSDAGDEEEFTETNVLLGYASKEADDDTISRLGGHPEWLGADSPASAALARCKICKDIMVLLLQLNGELPSRFPGHERRLYVFSCRRKSCRRREGSVRAVRGVKIAPGSKKVEAQKQDKQQEDKPKKEEAKAPSNLGETLFGAKTLGASSSANPFSTSSSAPSNPFAASSNPFSAAKPEAPKPAEEKAKEEKPASQEPDEKSLSRTFAETLSLNNPQAKSSSASGTPPPLEPWPPATELPKAYPISYLADADYETLDPTPLPVSQATTQMDVVDEPGTSSSKEDRDVFESSMDADFQKFADRLAQNPEQVIRYEFGGQPLLYSRTDAVGRMLGTAAGGGGGMPRCANCGSGRAFEVQLVPEAIGELEVGEELSVEDGMDWGTVIVGVCAADCQARGVGEGEAGYLEEWVGVQWEEVTARR